MYTYEDAIKQLVGSGKVDKVLKSDKARLLSTPIFTPAGDVSSVWAEYLAHQRKGKTND